MLRPTSSLAPTPRDDEGTRPGHDLRYALNGDKLIGLGWKPPVAFEKSLERTVNWTVKNPIWISL